jgi:1-deoxy-D-xylulose-5-phosphate reductoisomerase
MNLYILGATGSIGTQTLDIVKNHPDEFEVVSVTCNTNITKLKEILLLFHPKYVAVQTKDQASMLQKEYPTILFGYGKQGLLEAATYGEARQGLVVNAIVGSAGLAPTVAAIKHGRNIALANKETLVIGGEIIKELLQKYQVSLFPIDSEHSAIWQCLKGEKKETVKRIIITASGGSFRDLNREQLKQVTKEDALAHPNWSMGAKITIDSATMMNKGLEVIEAHHLFDLPFEKIDTILHKESVVHSLVEFNDNSIIAHLGPADMRIPINYALFYPNRTNYQGTPLDLEKLSTLHFEKLSKERFVLLALAIKAGKLGGYAPTVLNAANEAAVSLFLNNTISFLQIEEIVLECMTRFSYKEKVTVDRILEVDSIVKKYVYSTYTQGRE